ncbi:MAG: prepilin-type N-terminal cleavage/methylation domain-containing protein [Planctomycetes bacterium]|nr:prepilin-type N-terminal cleavage/methylation domain-containing protein [Planctomycetota bacterium]
MPRPAGEAGFTLIEALVALAIVATVVISFLGIRTKALVDTMYARNWRLAREIAEERMSELQAGAHDTPPESDQEISLADKYEEGWSYKVVIGESAVADVESNLAEMAAGDDSAASERAEWEQNRERYRKAQASGLSSREYEDRLFEEAERRLEDTPPTETDFEEVAVVVMFPKLDPDQPGERDSLMIKARVCTLAISGLTPEQAEARAEALGQSSSSTSGSSSPFGSEAGGK